MKLERELTCSQIVELVTDYLEQRLSVRDTERFEEHVAFCDGCSSYFDQMRATIAAAGRLREGDLPPELEARLLEAFRGWSSG
jgi:predicted anti-sigma-YlaC factor YlaD